MSRGTDHRSRSRAGGLLLVLSLVAASIGLAVTAAPASAASAFDLSYTTSNPAIAGAGVDVTFHVYNGGPDVATGAFLSVTTPPGLTAVGATYCVAPSQCLIGSFGVIGVGVSTSATIRYAIDPDYVVDNGGGGPVAGAVLATEVDYSGGGQTKGQVLNIGEESDLRINKYVNPQVANAGTPVAYQIDVDNLGPSTARNVTIQDTLFGGVGVAGEPFTISSCSFSTSQGGGLITQFTCSTGNLMTVNLGNDIGTFATDVLQPIGVYGMPPTVGGRLRASFQMTANDALTFDNEARVLSSTPDRDQSNNLAVVSHSFSAVADLGVDTVAAPTSAAPGELVTYTVTATNNGPSVATNAALAHQLPAGVELVSATTPSGSCLSGVPGDPDRPVVCLLGTIGHAPDPNTAVVTVVVRVKSSTPPGTDLVDQAWIGSDTPDLNNSNDGVETHVTVLDPDLMFNPVTPSRQFDTRDGTGGVPVGKVPGGTALEFTVTGVNGIPTGVSAVALNVTIANPTDSGWAGVYPCASPPAGPASNLNFEPEQTVANAVIAPVDAMGKVCFFTTSDANIISDVSGWFRPASGFTSLTPVREFDTRDGTGGVPVGKLAGGSALTFQVTGVNGVPAAGVSAVVLNVTVAEPDGEGLINVYPCGAQPLTSNLNYVEQQTVPNLVVAPVSPQGTVCFWTTTTTHLLADVSGWLAVGSDHHALNPTRLFDTRNGLGGVPAAKILPGGSIEVDVTGRNGIPSVGVGAVVLNVTATQGEGEGYATVYPCGDLPLTSSVNYVPGRNTPNAVIAPVSPWGTVCFYSPVAVDLVVDASGWFAGVGA